MVNCISANFPSRHTITQKNLKFCTHTSIMTCMLLAYNICKLKMPNFEIFTFPIRNRLFSHSNIPESLLVMQ